MAPEKVLVVKKIQVALKKIPRLSECRSALLNSILPSIEVYKSQVKSGVEVLLTKENTKELMIPIFTSRVQAGFPSPADDHLEDALDLNTHLIQHKDATFFVKAQGDSMLGAGIHQGDILIVDKSLTPKSGKIVIAVVDGEFTVKRLHKYKGNITLKAENPEFEDIKVNGTDELIIWGVVTSVIHQYD